MPRKTGPKRSANKPKPKPEPAQLKALEKLFAARDYRAVVQRVRPLIARFPDHGGLRGMLVDALAATKGDAAAGVAAHAWTEARPNSLHAQELLLYYAHKLQLSMLLNQVGAKARDLGGGTPGLPLPDEKLAFLREQPDGSLASIDEMVHFDLGRMYLAAGDYHGALRMLDGIDLIYARNNRGVAYFHLERCEEAGEVFLANWQAKRDNLFALAWAARSRLYRGDEPGAIELCQPLAAATAPRLDDALQQLELLLLMQRDQDAWDAFQRVVASDWYRPETELGGATLRHYAACAASRLGDATEARRLWTEALALAPDHRRAASNLHTMDREGQPNPYPRIITMDQVLPNSIGQRFRDAPKETDTDALLHSIAVATGYLRRTYLSGDDLMRQMAGLLLRYRARQGDAEAVRCLIEFPRLPIGTREERSAFLHLLREEGLIDADQPVELWDGKQLRKVKVFGATILRGDVDTGLPPDLDKLLIEATQDLSGGMFDAAEARLNAILERVPDHPTASGNLAALCLLQGRKQQGRELLERTVATHPDYLVARSNLARLLIQERNFDRAEAVLGDPSAINEIHIEDLFTFYGSLAMLHAARGNDESADAAIALLESLTEADEQPMLEEAKYLATLGRGYAEPKTA
jgi:tetratricopeptide (TPR) repeat protein